MARASWLSEFLCCFAEIPSYLLCNLRSQLKRSPAYSMLTLSSGLFPSPLLNSALNKMRAVSTDALVLWTLLPPKIPWKPSAGLVMAGFSPASSADRGGTSSVVPSPQKLASMAPTSGGDAKLRHPFRRPPTAPAAPVANTRVPGRIPPYRVPPLLQVEGLPVSAFGDFWSKVLGAVCPADGYRIPFKISPPPLARTPILFPTSLAGSLQSLALRQAVERMLF